MSDIKLFRLTTGEEILAKETATGSDYSKITDAVTLVYQQTAQDKMSVGFAPFMPYCDGDIHLRHVGVVAISDPNERMLQEYNRLFSNIVIAPANAI